MSILQRMRNRGLEPTVETTDNVSTQPEAPKTGAIKPEVPVVSLIATIPQGARPTFVPKKTPTLRPRRLGPTVPKDDQSFMPTEDVRRGRVGRRSSVPGARRSRKCIVNVSPMEYVAIAQAAEDQGISVSTLLRIAAFDAYGIERPHPDKVPTIAQPKKAAKPARQPKK